MAKTPSAPPPIPPAALAAPVPPAAPVETMGAIGKEALTDAAASFAQEQLEAAEAAAIERREHDAKLAAEMDPAGHDLHAVLTNEEVLEARAAARKQLLAKQRKVAREALIADEMLRLEREEGMTTGSGVLDEMVTIVMDLADHSPCITVNGEPFWHGHSYTRPRHVANSLREQMQRGWVHQHVLDGKSIAESYQRKRFTQLSPKSGVRNAPVSPDQMH